jgi:membrane protein YqaA with SNARE-associated domain
MSEARPRQHRLALAIHLLRRMAGARGFLPVIGLVAAGDYVLWFLPSKTLVIVAAMLHPRDWWRIAAWFTAGSVVGATAFAALVGYLGPPVLGYLFGDLSTSTAWQRAHTIVREWGALALFVMAALPWPLRTVVAACAVLGMPLAVIGASVATGRFAGFSVLMWICGHTPSLLMRSPRINAMFDDASAPEEGAGLSPGPPQGTVSSTAFRSPES